MALVGPPVEPPAKPNVSPSDVSWLCRPMTHPGIIGGGGMIALERLSGGIRMRGPMPWADVPGTLDTDRSTYARRLT